MKTLLLLLTLLSFNTLACNVEVIDSLPIESKVTEPTGAVAGGLVGALYGAKASGDPFTVVSLAILGAALGSQFDQRQHSRWLVSTRDCNRIVRKFESSVYLPNGTVMQ